MSEWVDLSVTIREGMTVYSPEEGYHYEQQRAIGPDCDYSLSRFSMGCHCGTHMDAPAHFIEGWATIDRVPPDILMGPAQVLTLGEGDELPDLSGVRRLILRLTGDGLTMKQAERIARSDVRLLGVNLLSVASGEWTAPVHRLLLERLWIIETLNLDDMPDGPCELVCLPLRLEGREASPARVMARPAAGWMPPRLPL